MRTSAAASVASDRSLGAADAISGNGTALLAVLVVAFALAVTGVVAVAGIRSSRRRY